MSSDSAVETRKDGVSDGDDAAASESSVSTPESTSYSLSPTSAAANINVVFDKPPELTKPSLKKPGEELGESSGVETKKAVQWGTLSSSARTPSVTSAELSPPASPAEPQPGSPIGSSGSSEAPETCCDSDVWLYFAIAIGIGFFGAGISFGIWVLCYSGDSSTEGLIIAIASFVIGILGFIGLVATIYNLRARILKRRQQPSEQSALISPDGRKGEEEPTTSQATAETRPAGESSTTLKSEAGPSRTVPVKERKKGKRTTEESAETAF